MLLWTLAGSNRITAVRDLILSEETEIFVSTASWWEIVIKTSIGKLQADIKVLRSAASRSGISDLPVLGLHMETLAALPILHRDPFDRLIVAQAITEPMKLLTSDAQLAAYTDLVQLV